MSTSICPCGSGNLLDACCGHYHAGHPAPCATALGLEVESSEVFGGQPEHAFVTFTARWHDSTGEHSHREQSSFVQNDGRWYFIDPTVQIKASRNDACLCGSGQKFKKCCSSYL